jgi:hypothetical protein
MNGTKQMMICRGSAVVGFSHRNGEEEMGECGGWVDAWERMRMGGGGLAEHHVGLEVSCSALARAVQGGCANNGDRRGHDTRAAHCRWGG